MAHTVGYTSSERCRCLENLQKNPLDLYLTYCGWEHCSPRHRYGPNKRAYFLIHIVWQGKGSLEIDGKKYCLQEGDAFFIPPGAEAWYEADEKDPWWYMWFAFSGLMAGECVDSAGFSLKNPVRRIGCLKELRTCIDQILDAHELTFSDELRRNGLLMTAMSALIRDYTENSAAGSIGKLHSDSVSVYVKQAMDYMLRHYSEQIKISELADFIGVNRSYLTSSFTRIVGVSPQEYLVKLRMEKAKTLLQKTDMAVNAVANATGYTDQLAFSKAFRRYSGMSPRMYKAEKNEGNSSKKEKNMDYDL
ncbi:MAG: AraC family transcriptional regulator [Lachnospiraceae bacterium]|nr:AraC family transcriptional regulator [Lachnospiraceae bacterium]